MNAKILYIEPEGYCDMCVVVKDLKKVPIVCISTLGDATIDICYDCICLIKKRMEDE
ncbi:hypothetical protein KAH94_06750 [bacterium]|nr:hypothetical protein [bacterium]